MNLVFKILRGGLPLGVLFSALLPMPTLADGPTVSSDSGGGSGTITYRTEVNEDVDGDGVLDTDEDLDGDGNLDVNEDVDGDGNLDVDEDTDGDGNLDVNEDTDGDGNLDVDEDTDGEGGAPGKRRPAQP